jgi:hypothetical protein
MVVASGSTSNYECHGLAVTRTGLSELDDGHTTVQIERSAIRGVTVCHGVSAERPLAALLFGAACVALGAVFARHLIAWALFGGTAYGQEAFAVGLLPIGGWLIHVALRRRYFLKVDLGSGYRKLAFTSSATRDEVLAFADAAGRSLGVPAGADLPPSSAAARVGSLR